MMDKSNYASYMSNPKAFTLKKWFYDLLGRDYPPHETVIERISTSLTTQQDMEDFGKLVTQIYQTAYKKAVDDYKGQVEKLGIRVTMQKPD